jgi:hypothetical protein
LPTNLPPLRRPPKKPTRLGRVFTMLLSTAMLVSALILTFMVLVREEQYASGKSYQAAPVAQAPAKVNGATQQIQGAD